MNNSKAKPRSWAKAWPMVTLTFAAVVFGALALDWDAVQAQEAPAPKAKAKASKQRAKRKAQRDAKKG